MARREAQKFFSRVPSDYVRCFSPSLKAQTLPRI